MFCEDKVKTVLAPKTNQQPTPIIPKAYYEGAIIPATKSEGSLAGDMMTV